MTDSDARRDPDAKPLISNEKLTDSEVAAIVAGLALVAIFAIITAVVLVIMSLDSGLTCAKSGEACQSAETLTGYAKVAFAVGALSGVAAVLAVVVHLANRDSADPH